MSDPEMWESSLPTLPHFGMTHLMILEADVVSYITQAAKHAFIATAVIVIAMSMMVLKPTEQHFAANDCGCAAKGTHGVFPAIPLHEAA